MVSALDGLSAYELGRARGACYGRTEPTDRDYEWATDLRGWAWEEWVDDFETGMLDGAEQAHCARIGLRGTAPPSAEVIAAAADRKVTT